ncbi:MAG TPA: hypothetical protein VGJ54_14965, partial [Streptosporangiaceae bacterium]
AVVDRWRAGQVKGLELGGVTVEEARALGRPAMAYVREQLRNRLAREISRQYLRWLHPTSRRRPGDTFPVGDHDARVSRHGVVPSDHATTADSALCEQ